MSVSREDFDNLVARVDILEASARRAEAMFGYIYTALHELDFKFDARIDQVMTLIGGLDDRISAINDKLVMHDDRFDTVDTKLDIIIRHLDIGGTS